VHTGDFTFTAITHPGKMPDGPLVWSLHDPLGGNQDFVGTTWTGHVITGTRTVTLTLDGPHRVIQKTQRMFVPTGVVYLPIVSKHQLPPVMIQR
jgi:hypothetical protein